LEIIPTHFFACNDALDLITTHNATTNKTHYQIELNLFNVKADIVTTLNQLEDASKIYDQIAINLMKSDNKKSTLLLQDLAVVMNNKSHLLLQQEKFEQALPHFKQTMDYLKQISSEQQQPEQQRFINELEMFTLQNIGSCLKVLGQFQDSCHYFNQATTLSVSLFGGKSLAYSHALQLETDTLIDLGH
jgi:tetratricopeptide (TPR) repeat protein